ncbi:hypothetical protein F5146DRAFT_1067351 [Armillaria mellea]|nr:hypothetical protein F5146DRAFT_1067351 [Armillaria mellea]
MRAFKIKLKFKLRLRAFFRRVKRRGKPRPVSLLTLPNELLQEVAYFRTTALSTIVLSAILINITLPFSDIDQDLLQYIASRPAGYVHKLRVCLWGSNAERHAPTDWDVPEGGNPKEQIRSSRSRIETKASSDAFRDLYNRAFASMNNLHAFTLCVSNGARKAPPFFFQETFNNLMKLPTIDLHLTHPEFTLPYFSHLSQFRNIRKFCLTGYQNNSTRTIEKTLARVLANNHRLSDVFLCLVDRWDRRTTRVGHLWDSTIALRSIIAAPHIFHHLHRLHSLQISNVDLYDTSTGFWIELARQDIRIPSITLKSRGVPTAVIDYLVSNDGMVELTFEVETDRENISKRVLSEVVPRHSRTLEVLQLTSCWGSHWAIGHLPEYVVGVSQCSKLHILGIVVEGNKDFTVCHILDRPIRLLSLLKALPSLQTLRLVAHTNDFTPVPLLKRLQVIVSVSLSGAHQGWDFDDEEVDVLRDDPWYLGP